MFWLENLQTKKWGTFEGRRGPKRVAEQQALSKRHAVVATSGRSNQTLRGNGDEARVEVGQGEVLNEEMQ